MGFGALLPDPWALSWGRIHIVLDLIAITLKASSPVGKCPLCQRPSTRVHSRYCRTLADRKRSVNRVCNWAAA
jgi:hypothetical protein